MASIENFLGIPEKYRMSRDNTHLLIGTIWGLFIAYCIYMTATYVLPNRCDHGLLDNIKKKELIEDTTPIALETYVIIEDAFNLPATNEHPAGGMEYVGYIVKDIDMDSSNGYIERTKLPEDIAIQWYNPDIVAKIK